MKYIPGSDLLAMVTTSQEHNTFLFLAQILTSVHHGISIHGQLNHIVHHFCAAWVRAATSTAYYMYTSVMKLFTNLPLCVGYTEHSCSHQSKPVTRRRRGKVPDHFDNYLTVNVGSSYIHTQILIPDLPDCWCSSTTTWSFPSHPTRVPDITKLLHTWQ